MSLRPWVRAPFELIVHGELHFRNGDDFDRRVALISFDNAIEVSIATFLALHPVLRGGRELEKKDVSIWGQSFHSKLDFLEQECLHRRIERRFEKADLVYYHQQRNDQYHTGRLSAPDLNILGDLRSAALWIFGVLYDVTNVEAELEAHLLLLQPPIEQPEPNDDYDRIIDETYGDVELAGGLYKTSEVLFHTDPELYKERALELLEAATAPLRVLP